MGMSFGNKNFRTSITKSGIGWSAGAKGFRVGHRANKKNNSTGWFFNLFIKPLWWLMYAAIWLMWFTFKCVLYYPFAGLYKFIKWIIHKIKANNNPLT